jgi:hypothetical protein
MRLIAVLCSPKAHPYLFAPDRDGRSTGTPAQLMPGENHAALQIAHVLTGLIGMGLSEMLERKEDESLPLVRNSQRHRHAEMT